MVWICASLPCFSSSLKHHLQDPPTSFELQRIRFDVSNEREKGITGATIRAIDADILAVQEVESLDLLDLFNREYLQRAYKYRLLIDGNDPRGINVGLLSRYPLKAVHTFRYAARQDGGAAEAQKYAESEAASTQYIFSRDCLYVEVDLSPHTDEPLHLYVNHFKSMSGGRGRTKARREEEQVDWVVGLLKTNHGEEMKGNVMVVGDFNDYDDDDSALTRLTQTPRDLRTLLSV